MNHVLLSANNPGPYTGKGNNTFLITGREPTLIDAGVGDAAHVDAVAKALDGQPLARVLVTHAHVDHVSGVDALAARWPSARFYKMPWSERDGRVGVTFTALADDERIEAGEGVLRAVHTPGHAPDHLCFQDEQRRVVFCGDLVMRGGTVMIPAGYGGSLAQYLESLRRVQSLEPTKLLPAHGEMIDDPASLLRAYLAHRLQREHQILRVLSQGPGSVDQIRVRIYPDLPESLAMPARETILAHLLKLNEEGRAAEADGQWRKSTDEVVPPDV